MKQAVMKHEARVTQDLPGKKIVLTREFDASPEKVWRAFTEHKILDQWWAPKPFRIETQTLDFKPGGIWHFCMIANGQRHYWRVNYEAIDAKRSITSSSGACDENANFTGGGVSLMRRLTEFAATPTG